MNGCLEMQYEMNIMSTKSYAPPPASIACKDSTHGELTIFIYIVRTQIENSE